MKLQKMAAGVRAFSFPSLLEKAMETKLIILNTGHKNHLKILIANNVIEYL